MVGGDVGHALGWEATKGGLEMGDVTRIEGIREDLVL